MFYLHPVDWLPINKLACIITELALHDVKSDALEVYNLVNSRPVPWNNLVDVVKSHCGSATQEASLRNWIQRLRVLPENIDEVRSKPALKMLEFFERMVSEQVPIAVQTKRAESASETMASSQPINPEWLKLWLA